MNRLSAKTYWDKVHENKRLNNENSIKNTILHICRNYPNYLIWEKIFPKYLKNNEPGNVIEIGCAPGGYLINFYTRFGIIPYGIEYSHQGVKVTSERFASLNLPVENIIEADFFDDSLIEKYRENFNVVYSRGFIEHFDDPAEVIKRHDNLLKKGGLLIIQIPNLRGCNFYISKFLNIDSHNIHNLQIMELDSFKKIFQLDSYEVLFCDYVGFFSFGLFNANTKFKKILLRIIQLIQLPLNFLFRQFSKLVILENRYTSPYLLMVARKK